MEIINHTPFPCAYLVGRVNYPTYSLTLIVKGTFDLTPGGKCSPAAEQVFPTGDLFVDDNMAASCRYESDFAYYKPRADLLLTGKCHAPGGKPVSACEVVFQVGGVSKTLAIFGQRYWRGMSLTPSDPVPFTEMVLCYENSFGGLGYGDNPVGIGLITEETAADPRRLLLPTIEDPRRMIYSPSDRPEVAGFAPLARTWRQRTTKLGTYDERYVDERWPWFPLDFDWGYFNAAPRDMQLEGFLQGDESLFCKNLHPQYSHYHCRLPGLRLRGFVNREPSRQPEQAQLQEVSFSLDTLWVDMEAEKLVLVWRGVVAIGDEDFSELGHLFLFSEDIKDQPASLVECNRRFFDHFQKEDEEFREESPEPAAEGVTEEELQAIAAEIAAGEEKFRIEMLAAGIDPDIDIPEPTEEMKAEEERLLRQYLGENAEAATEVVFTRQDVETAKERGLELCGKDLSGLDLSGLSLRGFDLHGAIIAGAKLQGADLGGCNLAEADLSGADLSDALLQQADLHDTDCTGAIMRQTDLTGANLENTIMEKAKLERAILREVLAKGCDFSGANLTAAVCLSGAFEGADFSQAVIEHANFQQARLANAAFAGVKASYADFDQADMTGVRAGDGSDFSQAKLRSTNGAGSIWTGADLTSADFSFADLLGADFSGALLPRAVMVAADLTRAKFVKAVLREAQCLSVNLFQGSLERAELSGTDFSGANLYGVEFLGAKTTGAKFHLANLKMTKLAKKYG